MKWFVRGRVRVIQAVVQPFLWLAIVGVGLSSAFTLQGGQSYLQYMAPGVIGMTLIFSSMMSGISMLWDKQFGFMKEVLVAPVSRTDIMLGKALGGTTVSIIQGLLLLLATGLFGVWPPSIEAFLQILVFMLMISLSFVSLGLVLASRIDDPIAFPLVMNFLMLPLFFLSGALFPMATAPGWMRAVSSVNPLTYGVDGFRSAVLGTSNYSIAVNLGVLLVFFVAMVLLGSYLFKRMKA